MQTNKRNKLKEPLSKIYETISAYLLRSVSCLKSYLKIPKILITGTNFSSSYNSWYISVISYGLRFETSFRNVKKSRKIQSRSLAFPQSSLENCSLILSIGGSTSKIDLGQTAQWSIFSNIAQEIIYTKKNPCIVSYL